MAPQIMEDYPKKSAFRSRSSDPKRPTKHAAVNVPGRIPSFEDSPTCSLEESTTPFCSVSPNDDFLHGKNGKNFGRPSLFLLGKTNSSSLGYRLDSCSTAGDGRSASSSSTTLCGVSWREVYSFSAKLRPNDAARLVRAWVRYGRFGGEEASDPGKPGSGERKDSTLTGSTYSDPCLTPRVSGCG
jgi:hypothetical protein